jgi:hypothetical protein
MLPQAQGLANRIGDAYTAFSGAIANQGSNSAVADPHGNGPATAANQVTEGLLGLAYDVGTAPIGYHIGPSGEINLPGHNLVVPMEETQ